MNDGKSVYPMDVTRRGLFVENRLRILPLRKWKCVGEVSLVALYG